MRQIDSILNKGDTIVFFSQNDRDMFIYFAIKCRVHLKIGKRSLIDRENMIKPSSLEELQLCISKIVGTGITTQKYNKMLSLNVKPGKL